MKHKKDGLESKVLKFKRSFIKEDENGNKYVPICQYSWHKGIILDENVCLTRKCDHYERLYFKTRPNYLKR